MKAAWTAGWTTKLAALALAGVLAISVSGNNAQAASTPEDEPTTSKPKPKPSKPKPRKPRKPKHHESSNTAVDPAWPGAPKGYIQAKVLAKDGQYAKALTMLKQLNMPKSANVLTYIGFTTRKLGRVDEGMGYYKQALAIKPTHKGANEYLGEAYLQKGDLASAKKQLVKLASICGTSCEEYLDLKGDIAQYVKKTN